MARFKQRIIMLHAKGSAGVSRKTNQPYSILSVEFINSENLLPFRSADGSDIGLSVAKENLPYELLGKITDAPAIYDIEYEMTVDYQMNMKPTPVDITYVSPLAEISKK